MIHEIGFGRFDNQYKNIKPTEKDRVLVFSGRKKTEDRMLVFFCAEKETLEFLTKAQMDQVLGYEGEYQYIFSLDGNPFFMLMEFGKEPYENLPKGASYEPIRVLRVAQPMEHSLLGATGYHLYEWYRSSQFCGVCGHQNVHDEKERMMRCPSCGRMNFPKICPAVIVAARKGDSVMMTRYAGREYKGRALLAGFCEIGESPEETVVREVKEEVGIDVTNVTYFGSQPWGFDSNLLLGYVCDAVGEQPIVMDEEELSIAEWVPREEIPEETNQMSLTATMIDAFRRGEI